MRPNGSGVLRVLVDADAAAVVAAESGGVPLEQAVRLSDLSDAGWQVGDWERAEDGAASIVLSKAFDSPDDVASIVREASGDDGPLRLRATRSTGFLSSSYSVSGQADLEGVTTGVPTDPELLANLSAQSVDPNVIDQQLLAQVKASFELRIDARLPGAKAETIVAKPGGVTSVRASSSVRNTNRLIFLIAALGFMALAVLMWRRGGRSRGPRRGRGVRPQRPPSTRGPRPGPHLPHPRRTPRPQVPHQPHLPHPHLPHVPHLPKLPHVPSRREGPAPPARKPRPGSE
jgi:hypothetical protein